MSNVVSMADWRKQPETPEAVVPQSIAGPIEALIDWAESNGIDVHNNIKFQFRLADFLALLQSEIAERVTA